MPTKILKCFNYKISGDCYNRISRILALNSKHNAEVVAMTSSKIK